MSVEYLLSCNRGALLSFISSISSVEYGRFSSMPACLPPFMRGGQVGGVCACTIHMCL